MLESSDIIAFSWSTDLARAREFYTNTLGLSCTEQSEFACVFDVNGTMLRVTAVPEVAKPGYTVLGWRVDSIEETIQALAGNGVAFTRYDGMDQDVSGVCTSGQTWCGTSPPCTRTGPSGRKSWNHARDGCTS